MREFVVRGYDIDDKNKVELQEELSNILRGIQRLLVMFFIFKNVFDFLYDYEVLLGEFFYDIINVV